MKYPKLVRERDCKTDIVLHIGPGEINEDGEPIEEITIATKCNYQGGGKVIISENEEHVELSAVCLLSNDVVPNLYEITTGTVTIFNEEREIYKGIKARNPDGSVNYIRLEIK